MFADSVSWFRAGEARGEAREGESPSKLSEVIQTEQDACLRLQGGKSCENASFEERALKRSSWATTRQ